MRDALPRAPQGAPQGAQLRAPQGASEPRGSSAGEAPAQTQEGAVFPVSRRNELSVVPIPVVPSVPQGGEEPLQCLLPRVPGPHKETLDS